MKCDVLIVGGGPAGTTVGTLLKRYDPKLEVVILERDRFPRDHIGESQLPAIAEVLNEMGVWEKVEAAGFPIKIGSTYRWGNTDDLWNLNFLTEELRDDPRPGQFKGQRAQLAFQVDRSIYDKILLDHAQEVGCTVFEETKAVEVQRRGDAAAGIVAVSGGTSSTYIARHYVDASGASGLMRRAMDVGTDTPTRLRNVAVWDYWKDAQWAYTVGAGGTRVQVMSLGWGWIWFIPITTTRTSIGLVVPSSYLKSSGKKLEELYSEAVSAEPRISELVRNASRENQSQATKDWSFVADRLCGENWFLAGDTCGFADPILAAGMTLAHVGARKVAYTILELEKGRHDPEWLRAEFNRTHRENIQQHIRFANYWYSANGCFEDLKEYCSEIAKDAGMELAPDAAFQWLSNGGFTAANVPENRGTLPGLLPMTRIVGHLSGAKKAWQVSANNDFRLNLAGAIQDKIAFYVGGGVEVVPCYRREGKTLPLIGPAKLVVSCLAHEHEARRLCQAFRDRFKANPKGFPEPWLSLTIALESLESLILDGWVKAKVDKKKPFIDFDPPNSQGWSIGSEN